MSWKYINSIEKKIKKGKTVENYTCPYCGETLKLILFGLIPDDSPLLKTLREGNVRYTLGGCCCYGDNRDPTYYCTKCKKGFSETLVLLEKVSCPLEAGGAVFSYECRDYKALKKNKRYRLLKDTEKICNIICPAIGKEVDIHTYDGRTVRGTITRSIDYTYKVKENHVIVSKKTDDPYRSDWEDVFIKDIESIDILGKGYYERD